MNLKRMLSASALLAVAGLFTSLPASATPPKSFIAPGGESYKFDVAFGEYGSLNDQFIAAEGVDVDAQGNVWVADTNNHRISKFDPNGNYLFSFGGYGSGDGQFYYPKGIFVDTKRGAIWVSDTSNNRVQKFDLKGTFVCKNTTVSAPRGLAVRASNGYVYVASAGVNSIARMTSSCNVNGGWGGAGSGNGQFSTPLGVALDADGNVYVSDFGNNRIQKFDANGNFVVVIGTYGSGDSRFGGAQFYGPAGLDIDASGDLLVSDYYNHRIQKMRTNGTLVTSWGWNGSGRGQLNYPVGIAADASGRVFVADRDNYRIVRFSPSTTDQTHLFIEAFGVAGSGGGGFNSPAGVATYPADGKVYVTDQNNHRVEVFDESGVYLSSFGGYGSGDGQFNLANQVAVDQSNGAVYVTDYYNHRVEKFTAAGAFVLKWGANGNSNGLFTYPSGVAVDPLTHDVYIADANNHRVQRFTQNGVFVRGIGNGTTWTGVAPPPVAGNGNSAFNSPAALAVDADGNLYVTEYYNHRVQKFDTNGQFVTKWGTGGSTSTKGGFSYPQGIAVDATGNVYVSDTSNHRVQRFTSDGRFVSAWGSYGNIAPVAGGLFNNPTGIALSPNGNLLYIADRSNNRVQRFERFGFKVTPTPAGRTIVAGDTTTFSLEAKLVGSNTLANKVAFKVLSGLPASATASFSVSPIKPTPAGAATTLTIVTDPGTAAKTYKVPVEIEGGGQTRVVTLNLKVTAPPPP